MTSAMQQACYYGKVNSFETHFSATTSRPSCGRLPTICGVEISILDLFERFSAKHPATAECANNIHYYNGSGDEQGPTRWA